jgi:ABC-type branched-subunit amino acid transport system substrate-binding protein
VIEPVAFDAAIPADYPCTSTQDCLSLHGANWVCREQACFSLASEDCGLVVGNYAADDVLLVGALLPLVGAHKSTGLPLERVLALAAQQDFIRGVPFGTDGPHPVAIVLCDESQNPARAAQHLVRDVRVPVILGPAFGDAFEAAAAAVSATGASVDGGPVVLISPYATAPLDAFEADAGVPPALLWRTSPEAAGEGAAMSQLVSTLLEPRIKTEQGSAPMGVALVWRDDSDGRALRDALEASLVFNGAPATSQPAGFFTDVSYGNPDDPNDDLSTAAVTQITGKSPLPALVIVDGAAEAIASILGGIEGALSGQTSARPYYLLSHGVQVEELLSYVTPLPSLRKRILLAVPGDGDTNDSLRELRIAYDKQYSDYPAETFGVPQAYDAFYLLAYALAAVRNTDVNGLDVRDGLHRVIYGDGSVQPVTVGSAGIDAGFTAILAGGSVALTGASGPLQFDARTNTPAENVQIWCVTPTPDGDASTFSAAGLAWSQDAGKLSGTLASDCLQ